MQEIFVLKKYVAQQQSFFANKQYLYILPRQFSPHYLTIFNYKTCFLQIQQTPNQLNNQNKSKFKSFILATYINTWKIDQKYRLQNILQNINYQIKQKIKQLKKPRFSQNRIQCFFKQLTSQKQFIDLFAHKILEYLSKQLNFENLGFIQNLYINTYYYKQDEIQPLQNLYIEALQNKMSTIYNKYILIHFLLNYSHNNTNIKIISILIRLSSFIMIYQKITKYYDQNIITQFQAIQNRPQKKRNNCLSETIMFWPRSFSKVFPSQCQLT
eukprot:TRINITY_DN1033_c1_g2_i2.p3 TRINITY_DN1033_c1_g2~~TRINITY_DN1033_c1_g2_i2.p3  ORF type:complete len:270 (+),score=-32.83 TRINITY_DN1033_c1_g2_i2:1088-1897(+)